LRRPAGFPTITWFGKREFSVPNGEVYTGARSAAAMLDFVNSKTGWGVALGGELDAKAGLVKPMDALVKEWVTHSRLPEHLIAPARESVLVTARATSESLTQEGEKLHAATYITIFEKALKDPGYIKVPKPRTQRALASPPTEPPRPCGRPSRHDYDGSCTKARSR